MGRPKATLSFSRLLSFTARQDPQQARRFRLVASLVTIRYMVNLIGKRDQEADQLNRQLQQAGKMASVVELSAGVAHEINNPLAIILTERQILLDSAGQTPSLDGEFKAQLHESLCQTDTQVHRCKRLTQNLLRFSRRTKSVAEQKIIQKVVESPSAAFSLFGKGKGRKK